MWYIYKYFIAGNFWLFLRKISGSRVSLAGSHGGVEFRQGMEQWGKDEYLRKNKDIKGVVQYLACRVKCGILSGEMNLTFLGEESWGSVFAFSAMGKEELVEISLLACASF